MSAVAVVYADVRDLLPDPPQSVPRTCAVCGRPAQFVVHHVEGELLLPVPGVSSFADSPLAGACPVCGVVHLACSQALEREGGTVFSCPRHAPPQGMLRAGLAFVEMQL